MVSIRSCTKSMIFMCSMSEIHLGGLDLNLIVALDALLRERHVTRAARRLGVTQSAASHSLARLRRLLGDPLLVRGAGGALFATPRAEQLGPAIGRALAGIADALRSPAAFEPGTARRTFHVGAADYADAVLLPRLAARLGKVAPHIDLFTHAYQDWGDARLLDGSLDLVLGPPRGVLRPAGSYEKAILIEQFTCIMRRGHPLARKRLTLARYCATPHLMVAPRGALGSFVDDALAAAGAQRRVAVAVPHFLVVPHVIAATDLIATLANRLVALLGPGLGLVRKPPPFPLPGFSIAMAWHERNHHDPAHRWFRDELAAIAAAS